MDMQGHNRWCILRTGSVSTLPLAKSLTDAGYEVWTPLEIHERRSPKTRKREEVTAALMPSFVFARSLHLADLIDLSRSPTLNYQVWDKEQRRMVTKGHPVFRLFRSDGGYPTVSDRELQPLRIAEKRTAPKPAGKVFNTGDRIKLTEGGFAGLSGIVERTQGAFALVAFPGFNIPVKIATWMLIADIDPSATIHVSNGLSEQAPSAKAA